MVTLYEKRAIILMLRDVKSHVIKNGARFDAQNGLINLMNKLLVDEHGQGHWRYGTPTMFITCAFLSRVITGKDIPDVFYMSHMPQMAKIIDEFSLTNSGNESGVLTVINKTINVVTSEKTT